MIKLYNGDCLEENKHIENGSVDLILTDLPYGTTACSWDEIIPFDKLWEICYRVLRPNGFIVLTASQPFTTKLINSNINNFSHQWIWEKEQGSNPLLANVCPMKNFEEVIVFSNEYKNYDFEGLNPLRLYFKDVMDFIGLNLRQINTTLGHRKAEHTFYVTPKKAIQKEIGQRADHVFKTGSSQFSLCTEETYTELINVFNIDKMKGFKGFEELKRIDDEFKNTMPTYTRVYNPQMTKGKQYTSGGGFIEHLGLNVDGGKISSERYPTCIIKFNTDKRNSVHPTQKPVALLEYLIKTYTNENDTVLDFTMGSGSTGVACMNLNRHFIGIELDKDYFDIAKERMNINTLREY